MNPHVLASLLKMYFRELPEPVFPFQFYDPLIGIAGKNYYYYYYNKNFKI